MAQTLNSTREDHLVAWLAALAITIHIAESALPSPLPGVKPGLANVVTLATLCLFGWRLAAWVTILRVLVGSLLIGTFLSPAFAMSAAGAACSLLILGCLKAWSDRAPGLGMSPVGYGIAAAMAHMAGQFWMAYTMFVPHQALLNLLPVLMTFALILGLVSGIITAVVLQRIEIPEVFD